MFKQNTMFKQILLEVILLWFRTYIDTIQKKSNALCVAWVDKFTIKKITRQIADGLS
jgi:hypothetical protein